jgi:hypothetical protein
MFRGNVHCKSSYLARQLSVFSTSIRYMMVKIAHFSFEVALRTIKYTVIYPGSGSSLEIIALRSTI